MNALINNLGLILIAVAVICTVVSIITQLTKEISFLNKIPTQLEVIVLSIICTVVAYFAYASYAKLEVIWYIIVAVVVAGIVIAYITIFGWEKLIELFKRFYKKNLDIKDTDQNK